jgi:hypothetical protein
VRIGQRVSSALLVALTVGGIVACSGAPADAVALGVGAPAPPTTVSARANIFGAGHDVPPDPGGGGPGVLPPEVRLPAGAGRVLTFPSVTGSVNPIRSYADFVGAAGDGGRFGTTDVQSFGGISGIVHRRNGMFLVGVLLADGPPPEVAPARLDVTDRDPAEEITPAIGQTFAVGDGRGSHLRDREGRTVTRPELLRDVWASDHHLGSNVVDAVVHTLRAKLGTRASVIEAVRGRGYRLREDWRVHLR